MKLPDDVEKSVEDLAKNVAKHKMAASIEIMEPKKGKKDKDHGPEKHEEYNTLMDGVMELIENWDPKTDEGREYLKDLEDLHDKVMPEGSYHEEEEY
ncbi:MAG: hypothetical protein Unbinned1446contig1004_43 [Prokaryotic dsDNA virus sp.]|nr:MAG: hypothetical protein Unbinned1446contig1004_43 [Prokaryotic dsDNA virus sp.]|tara:strand:+ start:6405 stop:6695 length:291 start_codon:yes stop_codon:yes gene_type:complete